ncbi:ABC transporter permease [Arthrobacter agilis]|uniref:ABC transporter permease n=1 Tax=Arthrobacter agilis TaxID=37921 RepID=UPI002784CFE7|nr:ABC transporter permease [Arthrobacter agilis]MDQ0733676.1 simple sugar transport system permease protein [Arthrobacter agilis]
MSDLLAPIRDIRLSTLRGANNEGVLALVLLVLIIAMALISPSFFTVGTLFSILRGAIVPTVFALGVLIVIISGGIDVSFAAIAIFAGYSTVRLAEAGGFDPGLIGIFVIACGMGALLGLVNGAVIARFRLSTLIVTLGTQGIFRGILVAYIGSRYIADLPASMSAASTANIISIRTENTDAFLHVLVVPVVALCVLVAWLLRGTIFGRGIYAVGGDAEAARRAGFAVTRIQITLYVLAGVLAAFAGVLHVILGRNANPQALVGTELDIIAAVVLGGASIFGGRGSVLGTVLGVLLVQLINNSLILVGVPTAWQRTAVGVLLIVGVGIQALSAKRQSKRVFVNEEAGA